MRSRGKHFKIQNDQFYLSILNQTKKKKAETAENGGNVLSEMRRAEQEKAEKAEKAWESQTQPQTRLTFRFIWTDWEGVIPPLYLTSPSSSISREIFFFFWFGTKEERSRRGLPPPALCNKQMV